MLMMQTTIQASADRSLPEAQALLAALPVAVLAVDAAYAVRYINHAAEEWLGISAKHCAGRSLAQIIDVDARMREALSRVLEHGESLSDYDRPIAALKGGAGLATLHISPLEERLALLVIDVRPHAPLLREQVSRADIMRNSGMMAAMLAHEVKNPLSGIRGAAQLLKDEAREDQQSLLTLICDETDRIRGVLAQVEPFSDESAAAPEKLNIHEALDYVKRAAEAGVASHVRFVEDYDASLPPAAAVRASLLQVLLNMLTNAAEALEGVADAQICLVTTARTEFRLHHNALTECGAQNHIHILIEDNGPGVPPEMQAQLFEPFISSKRAGRGLGLAIAAKLMADMGGHVLLEISQPGLTRFRITLPVAV